MKNSKKSFQELVSKMEPLTEKQEGKLKGGFAAFTGLSNSALEANQCTINRNRNSSKMCSCTCNNTGGSSL